MILASSDELVYESKDLEGTDSRSKKDGKERKKNKLTIVKKKNEHEKREFKVKQMEERKKIND